MDNTFANFLENAILNEAFGGTSFTPSGTLYVGLSSSAINDDGTGITEPTGTGYARVAFTNDKTNWTTATTGSLSNAVAITFPQAGSNWGEITHTFISDQATTGNMYCHGALTSSKNITTSDTAEFAIGSFVITLD